MESWNADLPHKSRFTEQKRKPYRKPKLDRYGSLCDLTRANSNVKSHKDGGSNNSKTA